MYLKLLHNYLVAKKSNLLKFFYKFLFFKTVL